MGWSILGKQLYELKNKKEVFKMKKEETKKVIPISEEA